MEYRKNKIGFILFIIFLFVFGIGGFFVMRYFTDNKTGNVLYNSTEAVQNTVDYRVDKSKDYLFYDKEEIIINDLNIAFRNVNINLEIASDLNKKLNDETNSMKNSVKYIKDVEMSKDVNYEENEEGIYSVSYRDYIDYQYENFISLIVKDNEYDIVNGNIPKEIKCYIFDKYTNTLLNDAEILEKYQISIDQIKDKVKIKLNAEQEIIDGEPFIKVDNTLNNFRYAISINKIGKLQVDYIVSSTKVDFYDNIVME